MGRTSMPPRLTNAADVAVRMVIDVALAGHLAAALVYWWLSPKGFPVDHSRFWLNWVLPLVLAAMACAGLIGMHRRRWEVAAAAVLCFATAWCAGAIYGRIAFPTSLRGFWLVALCVAAGGLACFFWLIHGARRSYRLWLACIVVATILGVFPIWAQTPPASSTRPANELPPNFAEFKLQPVEETTLPLSAVYELEPVSAELSMTSGNIQIRCRPVLEFDRISTDGFWSLFARSKQPTRAAVAQSVGSRNFQYSDRSVLVVAGPTIKNTLQLTAFTSFPSQRFSHLNTFCYLEVRGHKRLALSFSPCSNAHIEVLPADYPIGRPARLAYLDGANQFHVVEATSGEKGPFRPLAGGEMTRDDSLTIAFHDEGRKFASITLFDWSRQISTDLSPTAGWGLPMNAIEFQRLGDNAESAGAIWITLAATAVGRGWETVGHLGGIYRNRMEFRIEAPP